MPDTPAYLQLRSALAVPVPGLRRLGQVAWPGRLATRALVANAGALAASRAIAAVLGLGYWSVATRLFPAAAVGFAATSISAMTLLGTAGMLGIGSLLLGELPRQPGRERPLIGVGLLAAGLGGLALGTIFIGLASRLSADLTPLASSVLSGTVFALGVGLTAMGLVLDDALLGWLRGELQVLRNALFAASKVAALVAVGLASLPRDGLLIYTSWAVGILVSLVGLAGLDAWKGRALHAYRPRWQLVRQLRRAAMLHHLVNLALQAPPMALPLLVTTVLSTTSTAYFYPAWMVASFAFVGPIALATAFYPVGAAAPDALALRLRFSLLIALLVGLATYLALLVGAELLLSPFGRIYAAEGAPCLQLLGLGIFPLIVKEHYVVIRRLHGRLLGGAAMLAAGGLLELVLAALGATLGGLTGLSLGWVLAVCVEAVVMAPTVYRATNLQPGRHAESPGTV